MDDIPMSEFSYYTKWGYIIAEYASSHYSIQLSAVISLSSTYTMLTEVIKGI
jgi:hypothetical protein